MGACDHDSPDMYIFLGLFNDISMYPHGSKYSWEFKL